LSAERVALNFLQHLSGIATLTARCVAKVKHTKCTILDTRKTLMGLRSLQKYAVRIGGGTNHRLHLADRILIKNNHLALAARTSESPLAACLGKARKMDPFGQIEVEVGSPFDLPAALEGGAQALLLDNMTVEEVGLCVRLNQGRAFLEASGGMTLDTIASYAETGIDAISIGALTHSAAALDISLRIE
jgi:nicotinate-nucleotide pyrophosphorylase (carboxylating)